MPRADKTSLVLSGFNLHSPFTGVAHAAYLPEILHCTMANPSIDGHDIVNENKLLTGIFRDTIGVNIAMQ
jgi:hypothetical protein